MFAFASYPALTIILRITAIAEGGDIILPKTSWSSSSNPKLMQWLRGAGIESVLVCGLITSVCVQHSAFSIFEAGSSELCWLRMHVAIAAELVTTPPWRFMAVICTS